MKFFFGLLVAALTFCDTAIAAMDDPLDLQIRYGYYYATLSVNKDGTSVGSYEWSKAALKESALERVRRAAVQYDAICQKIEVTAAYTLKADGRRIESPKDNYHTVFESYPGWGGASSSGITTLTIDFPDVAVGDSVVFAYRLIETEPMYPGHYSATQYFYRRVAYDDVRVRVDYPASMWVQYEARDMKETENSTRGDRKIIEWRYSNPQPVETGRRDFSVFDPEKEAGYAFSTYKTYAEIADAYGRRALPKAVPTGRITKLAAEIVAAKMNGRKSDPKEEARALYEWVATNIATAGSRSGIGSVVPHDLPFVLDNKMGDCKDHAMLLQALFAARGIKSVQALVQSSFFYRLPKIPLPTAVNHVINYLPAFDLYVDSTFGSTPFGMLPYNVQDKPVLLLEGYKEGVKTPASPVGSNRQHVKSIIKISPDDSATGSVEVVQQGLGAVRARSWARHIGKEDEKNLVGNMLRQQGMTGGGKFVKDDPVGLTDKYHYQASFKVEKFVQHPRAVNIDLPLGLATPMRSLLQAAMEGEKEAEVACSGISAAEDYVIELPSKARVLAIPADVNISGATLTYTARYQLHKNILTARRTLDERTPGNVCPPQFFAANKEIAEKAMANIMEQVLYR